MVKDVADPRRGELCILQQRGLVLRLEITAQSGNYFIVDMPFVEPAQRLDDQSAWPAGRRHVARNRSLENDFPFTDGDAAARINLQAEKPVPCFLAL